MADAREGSFSALGQLLDHYRGYLLHIAASEVQSELGVKVAPSDLVQQTFFEAARGFAEFRGQTERELRGWLRQILVNELHDARRRYFETQKRGAGREIPLDSPDPLAGSASQLECRSPTPSSTFALAEARQSIREALEKLPDDYRRVIELRTFTSLSFEQVGEQLGRSSEASRRLWSRAIQRLSQLLEPIDERRRGGV